MEQSRSTTTPTTALPTLSQAYFDELTASVRGDVYRRGDNRFQEHTHLFNGNILNMSQAVVLPLDAQDVSKVIIFCNKHGLSPSVKAGGYGTGGWAINGDVVIDLSKIQDIDIEPPQRGGEGYTSLRDTALSIDKGKARVGEPVPDLSGPASRQNLLEGDAEQGAFGRANDIPIAWLYGAASPVVANFLHGPALPPDNFGEEPRRPPVSRPGLSIDNGTLLASTPPAGESINSHTEDSSVSLIHGSGSRDGTSVGSSAPSPHFTTTWSTHAMAPASSSMSPSRQPDSTLSASAVGSPFAWAEPFETAPSRPDPFAYIDNAEPPMFGVSLTSPPASTATAWGADAALLAHPLFAGDVPSYLTRPVAPHTHAYVSFGAGARQKDVDLFTASHPLDGGSVPYHVPFSAHPVGASVMLLGGFGFLSRLHGLSIDNLVEAEVVLADGSIVFVNEKEHPDLWWGLRGCGSAFCIATRYKARAYPVPVVFAGNLIYRFHRATAPSLLRHFRDCVKGAPRELYANVLLTAGPVDKDSLVVIQMCYVGPKEQGLEYLQALSSWTGERCLLNEVHEKTFLSQQDSVAQVLRGRRGNQWFIRSALISSLPDEVINKTVLEFADTPVGCTWLFELAGGAIADYEGTCVPKAQRQAAFTIAALHQWEMGVDDPRCVSSAEDVRSLHHTSWHLTDDDALLFILPLLDKQWLRETIKSVACGGAFPSFLGRHELPARVAASFGENWERLVSLKKDYDPNCLFKNTFWPLDKDGREMDPSEHEPPEPEFREVSQSKDL
ncbi:hypothetical protein F5148DRAFT_976931 [Russula earlei]|uniref:Uncharacterized protein n=1 Tax=Russula earlei TaxID=71964 RepID=A0ACC0UF25_9AGAM|nr:hypothetical protein F5148DRAFT_976931 [Russula earlei]